MLFNFDEYHLLGKDNQVEYLSKYFVSYTEEVVPLIANGFFSDEVIKEVLNLNKLFFWIQNI